MANPWSSLDRGVQGGFGVEVVGQEAITALLRGYRQPELDDKLKVGLKAAGSVLRKSVQRAAPARIKGAGVKPGFTRTKSGAPSKHQGGDLFKSIGAKTLRGTPIAIAVGPVKRHSGMRHLAINPTKAHDIKADVHGLWIGNRWTNIVHHPGNHAHPWVAAGVSSGRAGAMDAAARSIFSNVKRDPSWSGWVE